MKKILFAVFSLIFIMMFSAGAMALDLGSETQKASNPSEYDIYTDSVVLTLNSTYLEATCTVELSSYSTSKGISNNYNNNTKYDLNLTFNGVAAGVSVNTTSGDQITIKAVIPATLDAVSGRGIANKFIIGTITCNGESEDLYMQRANQLEFDDIYLTYGDDSEKLSDGEEVDELKPGDDVSLEVEIENTYSSSEDVEIDDVDLYVEADNDLDVDEDEPIGTIREDDKDTEIISFDLDNDADEGTYDLYIWTLGSDDYNARHGTQMKIRVEIDKEKDDISLKRVDLYPGSVSLCDSPYAKLTVSIENIGSNDQDDVMLTVKNSQLNYYQKLTFIELEEDDVKNKKFTIEIPKDAKPGSYRFEVEVYNDDNEVTDSQQLTLLVKECYAAKQEQTQTPNYNVGTTQITGANQPQSGALATAELSGGNVDIAKEKDEKSSFELSMNMMIALVIILLLLIALMVFIILK